jgi:hypothetical protein
MHICQRTGTGNQNRHLNSTNLELFTTKSLTGSTDASNPVNPELLVQKPPFVLLPGLLLLTGFLLNMACAVNPPEFVSMTHRLVVIATDAGGGREERLSFFTAVSDKDGIADLDYLFVMHDASETCWLLSPDSWIRRDEGDTTWLGSNGLKAPDGPLLPRGEYRVVLVDKAGERAERRFQMRLPDTTDYALPTIRLDGNQAVIESPYPTNTLFFLDPGNGVIRTVAVNVGRIAMDTLWGDANWRGAAHAMTLYSYNPQTETGFFSWTIRLTN